MNIYLAIKPAYAAAILTGTKTVELRSYLPAKLHPGDTIYLVGSGRVWGHCTFAGATPAPPPGICRDLWLESIATPAAVPVSVARQYLPDASAGFAWHLRYPVSYGTQGLPRRSKHGASRDAEPGCKYPGATLQRFAYTTATPAPAETHPSLANYLLYLKTHKTP